MVAPLPAEMALGGYMPSEGAALAVTVTTMFAVAVAPPPSCTWSVTLFAPAVAVHVAATEAETIPPLTSMPEIVTPLGTEVAVTFRGSAPKTLAIVLVDALVPAVMAIEVVIINALPPLAAQRHTACRRAGADYFAGRLSWHASTIFVGSTASLSTCSSTTFPCLSIRNVARRAEAIVAPPMW